MATKRVVAQERYSKEYLIGDFVLPTKVIKSATREILRKEEND